MPAELAVHGSRVCEPYFPNRNDLAVGALTVRAMTELSVEQAAHYLGVSDVATYKMIRRRELSAVGTDPVRLALADVQALHQTRQMEALSVLERRRRDPVTLAREVRDRLHPRHLPSSNLPGEAEREQQFRVSVLPGEAKTLFGLAALKAAAATTDGCRWCLARELAAADGTWAPDSWREAFAALLGETCATCAPGLIRPRLEELRREVHGGATSPSAPAPRPSAEEVRLAREWVREQAVTAAVKLARPVGDDGGRSLVARRLREVRAQLKAAKRRGDQRHVLRLASMVRDLEADAARVDGRAPSVSSRPGKLACGHLLAARCNCPRKASR